jgi:CHAT domain-containing protein
VEDSATSELMQLFYQKLLQGASKVQALCDAQRAFIQGTASARTHPYYWAAFHLVGQTDPLHDCKPSK